MRIGPAVRQVPGGPDPKGGFFKAMHAVSIYHPFNIYLAFIYPGIEGLVSCPEISLQDYIIDVLKDHMEQAMICGGMKEFQTPSERLQEWKKIKIKEVIKSFILI
jgi:hypothetical protein